jgi:curved DNA-binding protein CbpA
MNEQGRSHYDVLGVKKNASLDEIRLNYRAKVLATHPDRVKGKEDEFRRASEAFQVLSHAPSREEYDLNLESKVDSTTFEVQDPTRLQEVIGRHKPKSGNTSSNAGQSFRVEEDARAQFREIRRPRAPETQAEFQQRVQARAAPVIKVRSGTSGLPIMLGGLLLGIGTFYALIK